MASVSELSHIIKDGAAALTGQAGPEAKLRLARSVLGVVAPEYAPAVDGVARLASHMGLKLTDQGLDASGLRTLFGGDPGASSSRDPNRPRDAFFRRIRALESGVVLIMGPRGLGKTQLAAKLAYNWRAEHGYPVIGVQLYRSDRRSWMTFKNMDVFAEGVDALVEAMDEGEDPPSDICHRVVIIDEAVLSLHPKGKHNPILAVERIIWEARHLHWLVVIVAHLTKHIATEMEAVDVTFLKVPQPPDAVTELIRADRDDAKPLWEAAAAAYRRQQQEGLGGHAYESWVYAHAPALGYRGMISSGLAGDEDPHPVHHPTENLEDGGK